MQRGKAMFPVTEAQSKGERWWGRREGASRYERAFSWSRLTLCNWQLWGASLFGDMSWKQQGAGKGKPGKEEETGKSLGTALVRVALEAPEIRRNRPHPMMNDKNTATCKAHCTRSLCTDFVEKCCVPWILQVKGEHEEYKSHHAICGKRWDKRKATLPEKSKKKLKKTSKTEVFFAQISQYFFKVALQLRASALLVWNILK